jgi:hypothetical protein
MAGNYKHADNTSKTFLKIFISRQYTITGNFSVYMHYNKGYFEREGTIEYENKT